MSDETVKRVKKSKKAMKKNVKYKNFKVDFDLNLNKTFNIKDILKKEFNISLSEDLKNKDKKMKKNKNI